MINCAIFGKLNLAGGRLGGRASGGTNQTSSLIHFHLAPEYENGKICDPFYIYAQSVLIKINTGRKNTKLSGLDGFLGSFRMLYPLITVI